MSEFNFDKLSNLEIPEKWVENTLNAPRNSRKSAIIFLNFRKPMTAAACLMVVCLVGFTLFTFKPNKDILPVDTNTPQSTESLSVISPTIAQEGTTEPKDTEAITEATEETYVNNTESKNPTEYISSDTKADETVNEPTKSQENPTTSSQEPTESEEPSVPDIVYPTIATPNDSSEPEYSVGDCIVSISPGYLVGNGKIYCRIYNSNHEYIGDKNICSDQHLAHFYSGFGSTYYYYYNPLKAGLILEPDTYTYSFYNEHSVPICKAKIVISYPDN